MQITTGNSRPGLSTVRIIEEVLDFATIYSVSWESEGDIDHFEVMANASDHSVKTLVHHHETNTTLVLEKAASSIEVAAIDRCNNANAITQQSRDFKKRSSKPIVLSPSLPLP